MLILIFPGCLDPLCRTSWLSTHGSQQSLQRPFLKDNDLDSKYTVLVLRVNRAKHCGDGLNTVLEPQMLAVVWPAPSCFIFLLRDKTTINIIGLARTVTDTCSVGVAHTAPASNESTV